ncbi:hypothetical protein BDZ89DRAFT_1149645 [Hymenopellis radicata]|nr:hypothetical protein BDZ89DRAFT_1149645 [Hymenopellis radicata]
MSTPNPPKFNPRELLDSPSLSSRRILDSHLKRLRHLWNKTCGTRGESHLLKKLQTVQADFLLARFKDCGIRTIEDLRHIAGLVLMWEYEGLLRSAMGLLTFGTNWPALKLLCAALRREEEAVIETCFKIAALQRQAVREKYRAVGAMLWKNVRTEESFPEEEFDRKVRSAFAAYSLDLLRF